MIFLTVGNWKDGYDRLVQAVDELVHKGIIKEEITAQIGSGKYKPVNFTYFEYCSPDEFETHLEKSRIVLSHAGMGSIGTAMKKGKPIIVLPRKAALGEVFDDHQFTTARQLEQMGQVLAAYEITELPAKLKQADTFVPRIESGSQQILSIVGEFIDAIAKKKKT